MLPLAQTAGAVETYYARAIGEDFLPPAKPRSGTQPRTNTQTTPDLPALGEKAQTQQETSASEGMSPWTKVLIGVAIVGAIAALGGHSGGGEANVALGGNDNPAPPTTTLPPPSGGGGGSSGGSGTGSGGGSTSPLPLPDVDISIGKDDKEKRRRR